MPLEQATSQQVEEMILLMRELIEELPDHKRRLKYALRGTVASIIIALSVGLMAIVNYTAAQNAEEEVHEREVAICLQQNDFLERLRPALVDSLKTLAKDPANLTEREQAIVDAYTANLEEDLPNRDCSPEGIDRYLNPDTATLKE